MITTFDYTYDPCGNMLTKTDSKGTTKYTYDALSRLKTVTEPSGKNVEYEYDKAGNRVREVIEDKGTLTVKKYKYNPQNRLMEVVNVDMGTGKEESLKYIYDNNGNQLYTNMEHTEKADPAAKPSFGMYISGESYSGESAKVFFEANNVNEYNVFNQLIRTKSGDTIVTYKYNGEGQRIEKTTQKKGDKKTIRYVRLGNDIALEMDSRGKLLSRNISGTAAISREIDGQKYFLLYNGEGDVTALSDRNGNLVEKYYYDAFGNVLETVDASNQAIVPGKSKSTLKYRGYEYDEETKLYYLNCRMYDPAIARFLQEDTYRGQANDPLSLNLYSYCVNNPIRYTDPTGHAIQEKRIDSGETPKIKTPTKSKSKPKEEKKTPPKLTNKDINKMNNDQLLDLIQNNSNAYAKASKEEQSVLHNQADYARATLVKKNPDSELISFYVMSYGSSGSSVEVSTGDTIALDTKSVKKALDVYNFDKVTVDVVKLNPPQSKKSSNMQQPVFFLRSPYDSDYCLATYNPKTHQPEPDNPNKFYLKGSNSEVKDYDEMTAKEKEFFDHYNYVLEKAGADPSIMTSVVSAYGIAMSSNGIYSGASTNTGTKATVKVGGNRISYKDVFYKELENFNEGYKIGTKIDKELIIVQYHGSDGSLKYWTPVEQANKFSTIDEAMDGLALLPEWGERNYVSVAKIPAGTNVKYAFGTAVEQVSPITGQTATGGGMQYLFSEFDPNWIVKIVKLK